MLETSRAELDLKCSMGGLQQNTYVCTTDKIIQQSHLKKYISSWESLGLVLFSTKSEIMRFLVSP